MILEWILGIGQVVLIFVGDLIIKNRIENTLPVGKEYFACKRKICFRKHHNKGVFMNTGDQYPQLVAVISLILSVILSVLFILSFTYKGSALLKAGLSLLLGGAFSNTYDRLKRHYVVDYLSFQVKWKALSRLIFNISDFCIIIGAMLATLGYEL